jgi:hypothetical protein
MAGTLTISTLSDGTNSTSATNCIQGSAKAWVNFAGTTGTIRASYNVSSVTRNGTGDYTSNFTSALSDANYSVTVGISNDAGGAALLPLTQTNATPTTTAMRFVTVTRSAGANSDPTYVNLSIFR